MNDIPLTQECLRNSVPGTGTKIKRISYQAYPGGIPLTVQPFHSGLRLLAATPANRPVMVMTPRLMKKPLPANAFDLRWTRAHQSWRHGGQLFRAVLLGAPLKPRFLLGRKLSFILHDPFSGQQHGLQHTNTKRRETDHCECEAFGKQRTVLGDPREREGGRVLGAPSYKSVQSD